VHEDLLNAVSNLVHRHVLRELHNMTGALLAKLDQGPATNTRDGVDQVAPAARLSTKPETIARRERKKRQRLAANGKAAPSDPEPATLPDAFRDAWPTLREEFRAVVEARSLSRERVAEQLHASKASVISWLFPAGKVPSSANMARIRRWLSSTPKPIPQTPAAPVSVDMTSDWPELRERLRDVIRDRGLTHAQIGQVLGVEGATVGAWIAKSHHGRKPGARALAHIREWLSDGAVVPATAAADAPPFVLSPEERAALAGHISLRPRPSCASASGRPRICSNGRVLARISTARSSNACAACSRETAPHPNNGRHPGRRSSPGIDEVFQGRIRR
jgi:transcriptional regulator with XRE-family HTH domain